MLAESYDATIGEVARISRAVDDLPATEIQEIPELVTIEGRDSVITLAKTLGTAEIS
ncbi:MULTISPECIES: hypothetical protein [unclassified Salinibacterium]|uniref:hypothetical protein n=1 Tax=unclassified Salinibacterium TaxID=2632331 RepID=UPI0018CE4412|nr:MULTISPECIES: hypothetical protein [unclassified Salinibacterium]MBH0054005.1 hypothetical protein [Salinibacterium sp. SWN139]MBH0083287.1 hypothetical protein [Salinibacterium sp. SWN167]